MKKFMSLLLSVLLVLSLVPMTATATEKDWNGFVYFQDGAKFSVEATEFTGSKDSYDFYAAGYDSEGKLLEIKKGEAAVVDGTLEGEVSFETIVNGAVTKEANPAIKTVKTMVWDGMTPIVRAGNFTFDDTGLTNGFYEPVLAGNISSEQRYAWRDDNKDGVTESALGPWSDSGKHDGAMATKSIYSGPINNSSAIASGVLSVGQYVTTLTNAAQIDRVVVYYDTMNTPDNEMRFYLAKSLKAQTNVDAYLADFNETTHDDITYLGYRGTNAGVVTDGVAKLVFEADGAAYKYLVADMNKDSDYGYVYEWQAYKKAAAKTDVVDEFTVEADYNGLAYTQDGPEFTVTANEFSTNATELYLVATAYDGANATGNVLAQERTKLDIADTLTGTVNLEKNGEVNPLMASVKVEVVDSLGNNVLTAWTKNVTPQRVTDDIYNNFTNGFYEPVVDGDTSIAITKMYRYTKDGNAYTHEYANASVADGKLSTRNAYNQSADSGSNAGIFWQDAVTFSAATKIDRIVAYPLSSNGVRFYLSPAAINTTGLMQAHFGACVPETTTYYYVGDNTTAKSVTALQIGADAVSRFVLDTNGGEYQAMIVDYRTGASSGNYDIQAYRKVQDEYEVSPHIVPTYEVAEDAAAFAYGSAEGTTPAMAVDGDPATAWVSNNESDYRDQLILDLGTAYTIDSLKITMAEGSAQDFVVYGMNTALNNERNTAITRNVSATEFDRTALTETITGLTAGENTVTTNGTETAFRYLVFEQDPENETNPAFGFADIKVYTTDAAGAAHAATGAVTKIEGTTVAVMERLYSNNNIWSSTPVAGADNILDSDPRTVGSPADVSIGWNSCSGHIAMLDLGTAQKVSQVVYQGVSRGIAYPYDTQYFMVIASNDKPVGVTFEGGAVTAIDSRIDILGRFDAGTNTTIVEDPGYNAGNYETGLLVFDVPEEFANKEYKYIGIMKIDKTGDSGTMIRTRIGTLQAYTAAQ